MPTTRPRYTVTDTGPIRDMLDVAARRWPEVRDRKKLLLMLASTGTDAIAADVESAERGARVERQREALRRAGDLVDVEKLLADAAWQ